MENLPTKDLLLLHSAGAGRININPVSRYQMVATYNQLALACPEPASPGSLYPRIERLYKGSLLSKKDDLYSFDLKKIQVYAKSIEYRLLQALQSLSPEAETLLPLVASFSDKKWAVSVLDISLTNINPDTSFSQYLGDNIRISQFLAGLAKNRALLLQELVTLARKLALLSD